MSRNVNDIRGAIGLDHTLINSTTSTDNSIAIDTIDTMEQDGGRAKRGQGGTYWENCEHRIALVDRPPSERYSQWVMVDSVRNSGHHGDGLTKTSIDSCGTILRIEGGFSFGKILRMAGYAKILQPILHTIRHDPG